MSPLLTEGKILLLVSGNDIRELLTALLMGEGYNVEAAPSEKNALYTLSRQTFDLIIAELGTPEIDAISACKSIRQNILLRHLPIILLMDTKETIERIKGIYAGADDYVDKPFEQGELLARVKAALRRAARSLDVNPLTKLPGNVSVLKQLEAAIKSKMPYAISYVDLNDFKSFNERYGFEMGDKVIRKVAMVLIDAMESLGHVDDFLGHIGGDDFIFITTPDCVEAVCDKIIADFDKDIPSFYSEEDRIRNYMVLKKRSGEILKIPFLTLAIGIVTNERRAINHIGEAAQIGTELRNYAKTFDKSIYIKDRRRI
jgi:diguanylate cyclase (GGDEF)-like protein